MFIVISNQLPTAALFKDITRAYTFRNMLVDYLRIDAEVIQTEGGELNASSKWNQLQRENDY